MKNREWCAIAIVLGLLVSIGLISQLSEIHADRILLHYDEVARRPISVLLTGGVQRPGAYECSPGTKLNDLLIKAGLSSDVNRKKVPFKKVLISSQQIDIPVKKRALLGDRKFSLEEN